MTPEEMAKELEEFRERLRRKNEEARSDPFGGAYPGAREAAERAAALAAEAYEVSLASAAARKSDEEATARVDEYARPLLKAGVLKENAVYLTEAGALVIFFDPQMRCHRVTLLPVERPVSPDPDTKGQYPDVPF